MSSSAARGAVDHDRGSSLAKESTVDLLRRIGDDFGHLVRMETLLARQELERSLEHSVQATAAIAAASVFAMVALVILALAAVLALDGVMPDWLAAVAIGGAFAAVAALALVFARTRLTNLTVKPEAAAREVKEDIEWAKNRLTP